MKKIKYISKSGFTDTYLYNINELTPVTSLKDRTLYIERTYKNLLPTVTVDKKTADTYVINKEYQLRYGIIKKENFTKELEDTYPELILDNIDEILVSNDTSYYNGYKYHDLVEKLPPYTVTSVSDKLKYLFDYNNIKYYINRGGNVIDDNSVIALKRMINSSDITDKKLIVKILEKSDVYASRYRFVEILCSLESVWGYSHTSKDINLTKIKTIAKSIDQNSSFRKQDYLNVINKFINIDFKKACEIAAEI